ncbi:MAG: prohibitin family protein [Cyclobacteriaceae bacterium]|nr:prohibitin family protein [Cyclobacteriaceae bacterium]
MDNRKFLPFIFIGVIGLVVIVSLWSSIAITLEPGQRGVLFKKFSGGLDKETIYGEGFHLKAPWNKMYVYEVRERNAEETMDVLDKNGLSINVDVSVRFHPKHDQIGVIHERFGPEYVSTLVIPQVRSAVRQVMGRYTSEEIYSTKRAEVERIMEEEMKLVLGSDKNNIEMTTLLIRSFKFPEKIKNAIETKLTAQQETLAMQYINEKEKEEAERKKIAAEGEAIANDIVNSSLTDKLLKMRGIEATLELAKSPNSKIVIVGSSKDGLPLILGNN